MKNQKGMAVPIALLLSVMFLMFAVMVMTVQKSTSKFTSKLNVELKAHYLALGGVQHTLLKIKELREYFYDALKWGYHVDSSGGASPFFVHDTPHDEYKHPITRVKVPAGKNATTFAMAMKYLDYFKCDIFSFTHYPSESTNSPSIGPNHPLAPVATAAVSDQDATNSTSDTVLEYSKGGGGPGWISSATFGDPFDGSYHMSNLLNDAIDPIRSSASGVDGIAEIISGGAITGNKADDINPWIRANFGGNKLNDSKSEEGLLRFSTRIIQTGDPNNTSDDTEEDSVQIIIIGIERPANTDFCERTWSTGSGGSQVVKLKKIEKIERRIGT